MSSKFVDLTRNVRKENISLKIGIEEEEKFRIMDHMLDNETEPSIIHLSENDDANNNWDEM